MPPHTQTAAPDKAALTPRRPRHATNHHHPPGPVRLQLGPAFLFLISAEAIAADVGLGYRIFLMRRYLSMDVILPYVAWITLLSYAMDYALARLARRGFSWAYVEERR